MGLRLVVVVASMNRLWPPIKNLSTRQIIQGKRPTIQTTITFVSEHNYERPHTNDGILGIEGQHPTKWIVTKRSSQNIITTLCGTNTSKTKEWHNDDDDDDDTNISNGAIEA